MLLSIFRLTRENVIRTYTRRSKTHIKLCRFDTFTQRPVEPRLPTIYFSILTLLPTTSRRQVAGPQRIQNEPEKDEKGMPHCQQHIEARLAKGV